ncbi:alpha,alpha-trehalose-phosphate synthase (UDP-forming) [Nitrospira sp. BLG_2]|uniref:alpha,alpha-trehalose-phosphate synthase (UDP-forming) n=1 Tax=Nitrospira sp. BLG_2 TaxID=3397507 RepID=UPI003B9C50EC
MRLLTLSLRFVFPLAIVLGVIAYGVIPLVDSLELKWFVRDLDMRSKTMINTMEGPLAELLASNSKGKILSYFTRILQDERLYALGFCDLDHQLLYETQAYPQDVTCKDTLNLASNSSTVRSFSSGPLHITSASIELNGNRLGRLLLIHDMSFIQQRSSDTKWYVFYLFAGLTAVISLVTVLVAHFSWKEWVAGVRAMLKGERLLTPLTHDQHAPEVRPLAKDLRSLVQALESDRRMRDESQISWTPGSLKTILHEQLAGDQVLIVSNRQPYTHYWQDQNIVVQVPASGLVSALEPVMRACSGIWVAHGNGSADRNVVDKRDHIAVPPSHPSYEIRRVWLTGEEEAGYYYGFANEGLWPLCHIAHVRPTFRSSDWKHYVAINERFSQAVYEEATTDNPVVLVQDYHFALLPKLIRDKLPPATIILFWHLPWPNAESFGICPWREEILEGLLGSSILGFHTRVHCNNFIDSVDRLLEARIDRNSSTVSYGGKMTAVNPYPISIEWPLQWLHGQRSVPECRTKLREAYGMTSDRLVGLGVERLDYTKGILERFMAVERLLELQPEWIGKFTFVQIAAPSRSMIEQYHHFTDQVSALAEQINKRFGRDGYEPICLRIQHHEAFQVCECYRGADLCVVSSLHDGMNLVAKEFVGARDDEQGVLILSQFTGAARELTEAVVINPYDIDQFAAALHLGLTMPKVEQRARMQSMRGLIQEFNVYRWAGRMLIDAARMRQKERVMKQVRRPSLLN